MFTWQELVELYRIHDQPALNLRARYNVAPTQDVPICRLVDGRRQAGLSTGLPAAALPHPGRWFL